MLMVDIAHIAGLVAAGIHPSPIPHCDVVTTTTHKTLRGPRGGLILSRADVAKAINSSVFPGNPGRSADARHRRQGRRVRRGAAARVRRLPAQIVANAKALADGLLRRGFRLVLGRHRQPPDAGRSPRTETHGQGGGGGRSIDAGITVNKNTIPFDPRPPFVTSGIRIGTPAVTTRGMREAEMEQIAELMHRGIQALGDERGALRVRDDVRALCGRFPVFRQRLAEVG